MKTLFLTLAFVSFSVTISAQDYSKDSNTSTKTESFITYNNPSSKFTKDVIAKEKFKYHEFLNKSRKSEENYQIGQKIYTKKQLVELLRKSAKKSVNSYEFTQLLTKENPQFTNYFSNEELVLLYQKFRERTLKKYMNDLATDW